MLIQSMNMARNTKPDANGRVRDRGMKTYTTLYRELNRFLKKGAYIFGAELLIETEKSGEPVPRDAAALCTVCYGDNDTFAVFVRITGTDAHGKHIVRPLAIIQGAKQGMYGVYRMAALAAKCELFLNGRGAVFESEDIRVDLTVKEEAALRKAVEGYGSQTHRKAQMLAKLDAIEKHQAGDMTALDYWKYAPEDVHRVNPVGEYTYGEYFEKLKSYMADKGLLDTVTLDHGKGKTVDASASMAAGGGFDYAVHQTDSGVSFDISIYDYIGEKSFAVCKTQETGVDAFFRMHALAAELFVVLDGCGETYTRDYMRMEFPKEEMEYLCNAVTSAMKLRIPVENEKDLRTLLFYLNNTTKHV